MISNVEPLPNCSDDPRWPLTLSYWRIFAADSFNEPLRNEIAQCVRSLSATSADWQAAIHGDAGAASGLVLRLRTPSHISARVDFAMTVLLNTAFRDAGAALVLSYGIRRMPFNRQRRAKIAMSWLVHNVWLDRSNLREGASERDDP